MALFGGALLPPSYSVLCNEVHIEEYTTDGYQDIPDDGMNSSWIKQSVENHIAEHAFTLETRLENLEEICKEQQAKLTDLHLMVVQKGPPRFSPRDRQEAAHARGNSRDSGSRSTETAFELMAAANCRSPSKRSSNGDSLTQREMMDSLKAEFEAIVEGIKSSQKVTQKIIQDVEQKAINLSQVVHQSLVDSRDAGHRSQANIKKIEILTQKVSLCTIQSSTFCLKSFNEKVESRQLQLEQLTKAENNARVVLKELEQADLPKLVPIDRMPYDRIPCDGATGEAYGQAKQRSSLTVACPFQAHQEGSLEYCVPAAQIASPSQKTTLSRFLGKQAM